jgi:hypothetical protein
VGDVYSWGNGGYGQLGQGDSNNVIPQPELVAGLSGQQGVSVSAGEYHSVCITAVGSVFSWGHGGHGALGHGNLKNCYEPRQIDAANHCHVSSVSAGASHTMLCVEMEPGGSYEEGWRLSDVKNAIAGDGDEESVGGGGSVGGYYASLPSSSESMSRPSYAQVGIAPIEEVDSGSSSGKGGDKGQTEFSDIGATSASKSKKLDDTPVIGKGKSTIENVISPLSHSSASYSEPYSDGSSPMGGGGVDQGYSPPRFSNPSSSGYGDRESSAARRRGGGDRGGGGRRGSKEADWVDEGGGAMSFRLFQSPDKDVSIPNSRDLYSRETLSK